MRSILLGIFMVAVAITGIGVANAQQDSKTQKTDGTVLRLSVTERTEVTQNNLVARLRFKAEADEARTLQNKINKAMEKGMRAVKKQKDVSVKTGRYNIRQQYEYRTQNGNRKRVLRGWRGQQALILESEKPEGVLTAVRDLQNMNFAMQNLSYQVTPELREKTRDSLLENAVQKLRMRAERVAKALGKNDVDVAELQIGKSNNNNRPRPRMMQAMTESVSSKMQTPTADPGETNITLTVSGKVILK